MTIHVEWGIAGARAHAATSAVMIIVDVLSFSTCVDVAAARGAVVFPIAFYHSAAALAFGQSIGAVAAGKRGQSDAAYSLSPASLVAIPAGTKLVLPSPNGSAISAAISDRRVFAGCLRNARAVAIAAQASAKGGAITVIAAGEHWADGSFRPAIEDLLGAGAILAHLTGAFSAEATLARDAYRASQPHLADLIRTCVSGRELRDRGYPQDVEVAVAENVSTAAPQLRDGGFRG